MGWKQWLSPDSVLELERDRLRASLVGVLEAFSREAFDLPDEPAAALAERFEALAAHLRAVAPGDPPPTPEALTHAVRDRRRAETAYLGQLIPSLQRAVFEVVREFSEVVASDEADDQDLVETVDALAEALARGDLARVRRAADDAVVRIRKSIERRQDRAQAQMAQMGQRLKELRARVAEAEARSEEDELTRLPNRAALDARLEQEVMVAELTGDPLSVVMLDVDHFKRFNDTHGHAAGDRVLEVVGKTLIDRFLRKSDFSARYGGEEFCVVLSDVPLARALELAERFRVAMETTTVAFEGKALSVTCSLGVAELRPGEGPDQVLARADGALYASKQAGRNRVTAALGVEATETGGRSPESGID